MTDPDQQYLDHCVLMIDDRPWLIMAQDGPFLTVMRIFAPGILECSLIDMRDVDIDKYTTDAARILENARHA